MLPKSLQMKTNRVDEGGTNAVPRPGDYQLGSLESRVAARAMLETQGDQQRFRVNVSEVGKSFKLEDARCSRSLWPNGTVFEMVEVGAYDITEAESEQIERWIRTVPINHRTYKFGGVGNG